MLVATFLDNSAFAGKRILFNDGQLTLEESLPMTPIQVAELDSRGELDWASDALRRWIYDWANMSIETAPGLPAQPETANEQTLAQPVAAPVPVAPVAAISASVPAPDAKKGHKVRNVVLGAIAGLIVLIVVAAALGGSNEDGPTDADTSGTGGIPAAVVSTPTPSPSASVISGAQYMEMLRTDRREILSAMSDVASQGAAGKSISSTFASLSDTADAVAADWYDVVVPHGQASVDRAWWNALRALSNMNATDSLERLRPRMLAVLHSLAATGDLVGNANYKRTVADLGRGLWVMSASEVFKSSCRTVSFRVLDKDAGSMQGKHLKITGQVFQIQDAGAGSYWEGYPDGIQPRTSMLVAVTNDGYGFWSDNIAVAYDGKAKGVYEDDIVTVWGTCEGQYSYESVAGYNMTIPLIHARYISK